MQLVSPRIWTRVAVSISYDDNHYTTGTYIVKYYKQIQHNIICPQDYCYIIYDIWSVI